MERLTIVKSREHEQWSGDTERNDPDDCDLNDRQPLVGAVSVAQREVDGQVAVNGGHAQVTDCRRCEEHVQTVPGVAQQFRDRQTV